MPTTTIDWMEQMIVFDGFTFDDCANVNCNNVANLPQQYCWECLANDVPPKIIECTNNAQLWINGSHLNASSNDAFKLDTWNGAIAFIASHWGNPMNYDYHDSLPINGDHSQTCQFTIDMHNWMVANVMPSWMDGPIDGTWFNAPHCKHCGSMGGWDDALNDSCNDCGFNGVKSTIEYVCNNDGCLNVINESHSICGECLSPNESINDDMFHDAMVYGGTYQCDDCLGFFPKNHCIMIDGLAHCNDCQTTNVPNELNIDNQTYVDIESTIVDGCDCDCAFPNAIGKYTCQCVCHDDALENDPTNVHYNCGHSIHHDDVTYSCGYVKPSSSWYVCPKCGASHYVVIYDMFDEYGQIIIVMHDGQQLSKHAMDGGDGPNSMIHDYMSCVACGYVETMVEPFIQPLNNGDE